VAVLGWLWGKRLLRHCAGWTWVMEVKRFLHIIKKDNKPLDLALWRFEAHYAESRDLLSRLICKAMTGRLWSLNLGNVQIRKPAF
jgi:hypothetical protein